MTRAGALAAVLLLLPALARAATVTVSAHVASNGTQNNTVYGRIPALQGVRPGAYTDTITVTVTY